MKLPKTSRRSTRPRTSWGRWLYRSDHTLGLREHAWNGDWYEIDLDPDYSIESNYLLDHVANLSRKPWASPKDVADLLTALDDLVGLGNFSDRDAERLVDHGVQLRTRGYLAKPTASEVRS